MALSGPLPLRLNDGTPIELRQVTRDDASRLRAGFEGLSLDTRTQRFLAPVTHLSPEQLRYFTDVDHVDHVAWGALDPSRPSDPGLGIGRWVRLGRESDVAEFSLTVVDQVQGRGLGTILLAVLYLTALSLDVRVLRGVVARSNDRMVRWMQRLGATEAPEDDPDDGAISFDLVVSPDPDFLPDTAPARALADSMRRVQAAEAASRDAPSQRGTRRGRRTGRRRRE